MDIKDTVQSSIKSLDKYPKWLVSKYKTFVREKAIERVKKELKFRQKQMSDFTDDEMETLLAEEEREVEKKYKFNSLYALLAILGINAF
jgi:phage-related minor tail protein